MGSNEKYVEEFALTPIQKGFLADYLTAQDSELNVEQIGLELPEPIDPSRLKQAWEEASRAFPLLRTHIPDAQSGRALTQRILPSVDVDWREVDLSSESTTNCADTLSPLIAKDRREGILPGATPLWRVTLVRLGNNHYFQLWSIHHIVLDGRSFIPILKEVFASYEELCHGGEGKIRATASLHDHVQWLEEQDSAKAKAFFQKWFEGFDPGPELSTQLDLPDSSTSIGEIVHSIQNPERVQRWLNGSEAMGVTANTLVQAAWALVITRYTMHDDHIHGAIRSTRHWSGKHHPEVPGIFIANLPVRVKVNPDERIEAFLKSLRQQHLEIRDCIHCPIEKIADWLQLTPSQLIGHTNVMFESESWTDRIQALGPEWSKRKMTLSEKAPDGFFLGVHLNNREAEVKISYDAGRHSEAFARQLAIHVAHVIDQLIENPSKLLREVSVVTIQERDQIIGQFNEPIRPLENECLHEAFEAIARSHPDRSAVNWEGKQLTYRELDRLSGQFATHLSAKGIQPGEFIGLRLPRGIELPVALIGILKAGVAYVPIDPANPEERQQQIFQEAKIRRCVITPGSALPAETAATEIPIDLSQLTELDSQSRAVDTRTPAYIIFTSGSTGTPKGVVNTHRGALNETCWCRDTWGVSPADKIAQTSSLGFDAIVEEMWTSWLSGAELCFRPDAAMNSYPRYAQWVEENQITILDLPTAFWHGMVAAMKNNTITLPSCVRHITVGGEATQTGAYQDWKSMVGDRVQWCNTYGPTEAAIVSTAYSDWLDGEVSMERAIPIGKPIRNVTNYIVDQCGHPQPIGIPGELWIGGHGVALGYCNEPRKSQTVFTNDPFRDDPDELVYHTGDLAWYDSAGMIHFIGRNDRQVKIRGYRIDPGEIENTLATHKQVHEAAVQVFDADTNHPRLAAFAVADPTDNVDPEALIQFLRSKFPPHMVPSSMTLLSEFPTTPNGKVDLKRLPDPSLTRRPTTEQGSERARNGFEEAVYQAWVLALGTEDIKLEDNFFAMGGDSLRSMNLIIHLESANLALEPQDIGTHPTILEMAAFLKDKSQSQTATGDWTPLVALRKGGSRPPLFLPHPTPGDVMGYGNLVHALGPDQPCWGLVSQGSVKGAPCHETINEMATCYVDAILAAGFQAPFFLAGWCYGGVVALEMAHQLRQKGHETRCLYLIDSYAPPTHHASKKQKLYKMISLLKLGPVWASKYLMSKINKRTHQQTPSDITGNEGSSMVVRGEVYKANMRAYDRYRAPHYEGRLNVIVSTQPRSDEILERNGGWEALTQNFERHGVDCGHRDILKPPAVTHVAEKIRESIEKFTKTGET